MEPKFFIKPDYITITKISNDGHNNYTVNKKASIRELKIHFINNVLKQIISQNQRLNNKEVFDYLHKLYNLKNYKISDKTINSLIDNLLKFKVNNSQKIQEPTINVIKAPSFKENKAFKSIKHNKKGEIINVTNYKLVLNKKKEKEYLEKIIDDIITKYITKYMKDIEKFNLTKLMLNNDYDLSDISIGKTTIDKIIKSKITSKKRKRTKKTNEININDINNNLIVDNDVIDNFDVKHNNKLSDEYEIKQINDEINDMFEEYKLNNKDYSNFNTDVVYDRLKDYLPRIYNKYDENTLKETITNLLNNYKGLFIIKSQTKKKIEPEIKEYKYIEVKRKRKDGKEYITKSKLKISRRNQEKEFINSIIDALMENVYNNISINFSDYPRKDRVELVYSKLQEFIDFSKIHLSESIINKLIINKLKSKINGEWYKTLKADNVRKKSNINIKS